MKITDQSNLEKIFGDRLLTLADGRSGLRGSLRVTATPAPGDAPVIDFIASDDTLDRYDEVISAQGWDLVNYRKNPVFQNAHKYGDIIFTLGKSLLTEVRDNALVQRIEFATAVNPMARIAYGLYKGKFLNAVSVGFIPLEWENGIAPGTGGQSGTPYRRRYLKQELLELSAVGIPANHNALALGLKSGAIEKDDLQETLDLLKSICSKSKPDMTPGCPATEDDCPECQGKAVSWCRCPTNHRTCEKGHTWHWENGIRVMSHGHYRGSGRKKEFCSGKADPETNAGASGVGVDGAQLLQKIAIEETLHVGRAFIH